MDRVLAEKQAELEREQCVTKEKMHLMKEILNVDNTNWDFLKENRDNYFSAAPSAPMSTMPSSNLPPSQASTQTPKDQQKRKSEYDLANYMSPGFRTPQSSVGLNGEGHPSSGPPVVNPRHRRSLSAGTERWIDHRPPGTISLGTVMQPKIKNKKSVTNLRVNDVQNASKYALTHHEADDNGEVETFVFKGEVIPSTSGGAQVIFNDVETLRQTSPQGGRKRTVSDTRLLSPTRLMSPQITTEADVHVPSSNNKRHRF